MRSTAWSASRPFTARLSKRCAPAGRASRFQPRRASSPTWMRIRLRRDVGQWSQT